MSAFDRKNEIFIPNYALSVMDRLRAAGEEVYIVGGCVRDALLGIAPHDYDMAVSCPPERTLEILSDFRTIATGLKHGTVTAISEGNPIELTTFRTDGDYTDSRHPDSVKFTRSINDDLSRRDFTVNAMAYSHESGLIDLFGGREDLEKRVIKAVGRAELRFSEDALRIMRAFRFSAQLGFSIDADTLSGAVAVASGLKNIARERIGAEFIRLLCSSHPIEALITMKESGILEYASPSYSPSNRVISLLPSIENVDVARLGLYLCEADEVCARDILNGLKTSNRQRSGALRIARESQTEISTRSDAAHLRARAGEDAIHCARASVLLGISEESAIELVLQSDSPRSIADLKIGGAELMEIGYSGREIGKELASLLEAAMNDPSLNSREQLTELAKKHKKEGE